MWSRFVNPRLYPKVSSFTQRSFSTLQHQVTPRFNPRFFNPYKRYATPISIGFLGWLWGGVDYNAVKKDIADILDDYDWDDGMTMDIMIYHIYL